MKKIFLLLVVISILFAGQVALAENASLLVSPATGTGNVGSGINATVQVYPAGNKVCVVKGTLVFGNLTCQNISVTSGLLATMTPTCASPSFSIGIPTCTKDVKNILTVAVAGTSAGSSSVNFSGVKVIGEGVNVPFSTQGATYTINAVVVQPVATTQPAPKVAVGKTKTAQPSPEASAGEAENLVTKDVGLASTSATMSKLFNPTIFTTILLIVAIAFAGMWAYEKFFKKPKIG